MPRVETPHLGAYRIKEHQSDCQPADVPLNSKGVMNSNGGAFVNDGVDKHREFAARAPPKVPSAQQQQRQPKALAERLGYVTPQIEGQQLSASAAVANVEGGAGRGTQNASVWASPKKSGSLGLPRLPPPNFPIPSRPAGRPVLPEPDVSAGGNIESTRRSAWDSGKTAVAVSVGRSAPRPEPANGPYNEAWKTKEKHVPPAVAASPPAKHKIGSNHPATGSSHQAPPSWSPSVMSGNLTGVYAPSNAAAPYQVRVGSHEKQSSILTEMFGSVRQGKGFSELNKPAVAGLPNLENSNSSSGGHQASTSQSGVYLNRQSSWGSGLPQSQTPSLPRIPRLSPGVVKKAPPSAPDELPTLEPPHSVDQTKPSEGQSDGSAGIRRIGRSALLGCLVRLRQTLTPAEFTAKGPLEYRPPQFSMMSVVRADPAEGPDTSSPSRPADMQLSPAGAVEPARTFGRGRFEAGVAPAVGRGRERPLTLVAGEILSHLAARAPPSLPPVLGGKARESASCEGGPEARQREDENVGQGANLKTPWSEAGAARPEVDGNFFGPPSEDVPLWRRRDIESQEQTAKEIVPVVDAINGPFSSKSTRGPGSLSGPLGNRTAGVSGFSGILATAASLPKLERLPDRRQCGVSAKGDDCTGGPAVSGGSSLPAGSSPAVSAPTSSPASMVISNAGAPVAGSLSVDPRGDKVLGAYGAAAIGKQQPAQADPSGNQWGFFRQPPQAGKFGVRSTGWVEDDWSKVRNRGTEQQQQSGAATTPAKPIGFGGDSVGSQSAELGGSMSLVAGRQNPSTYQEEADFWEDSPVVHKAGSTTHADRPSATRLPSSSIPSGLAAQQRESLQRAFHSSSSPKRFQDADVPPLEELNRMQQSRSTAHSTSGPAGDRWILEERGGANPSQGESSIKRPECVSEPTERQSEGGPDQGNPVVTPSMSQLIETTAALLQQLQKQAAAGDPGLAPQRSGLEQLLHKTLLEVAQRKQQSHENQRVNSRGGALPPTSESFNSRHSAQETVADRGQGVPLNVPNYGVPGFGRDLPVQMPGPVSEGPTSTFLGAAMGPALFGAGSLDSRPPLPAAAREPVSHAPPESFTFGNFGSDPLLVPPSTAPSVAPPSQSKSADHVGGTPAEAGDSLSARVKQFSSPIPPDSRRSLANELWGHMPNLVSGQPLDVMQNVSDGMLSRRDSGTDAAWEMMFDRQTAAMPGGPSGRPTARAPMLAGGGLGEGPLYQGLPQQATRPELRSPALLTYEKTYNETSLRGFKAPPPTRRPPFSGDGISADTDPAERNPSAPPSSVSPSLPLSTPSPNLTNALTPIPPPVPLTSMPLSVYDSCNFTAAGDLMIIEDCQWEYRDREGCIQGPFTSKQMAKWHEGGFFAPSLQLRWSPTAPWLAFSQVYPEACAHRLPPFHHVPRLLANHTVTFDSLLLEQFNRRQQEQYAVKLRQQQVHIQQLQQQQQAQRDLEAEHQHFRLQMLQEQLRDYPQELRITDPPFLQSRTPPPSDYKGGPSIPSDPFFTSRPSAVPLNSPPIMPVPSALASDAAWSVPLPSPAAVHSTPPVAPQMGPMLMTSPPLSSPSARIPPSQCRDAPIVPKQQQQHNQQRLAGFPTAVPASVSATPHGTKMPSQVPPPAAAQKTTSSSSRLSGAGIGSTTGALAAFGSFEKSELEDGIDQLPQRTSVPGEGHPSSSSLIFGVPPAATAPSSNRASVTLGDAAALEHTGVHQTASRVVTGPPATQGVTERHEAGSRASQMTNTLKCLLGVGNRYPRAEDKLETESSDVCLPKEGSLGSNAVVPEGGSSGEWSTVGLKASPPSITPPKPSNTNMPDRAGGASSSELVAAPTHLFAASPVKAAPSAPQQQQQQPGAVRPTSQETSQALTGGGRRASHSSKGGGSSRPSVASLPATVKQPTTEVPPATVRYSTTTTSSADSAIATKDISAGQTKRPKQIPASGATPGSNKSSVTSEPKKKNQNDAGTVEAKAQPKGKAMWQKAPVTKATAAAAIQVFDESEFPDPLSVFKEASAKGGPKSKVPPASTPAGKGTTQKLQDFFKASPGPSRKQTVKSVWAKPTDAMPTASAQPPATEPASKVTSGPPAPVTVNSDTGTVSPADATSKNVAKSPPIKIEETKGRAQTAPEEPKKPLNSKAARTNKGWKVPPSTTRAPAVEAGGKEYPALLSGAQGDEWATVLKKKVNNEVASPAQQDKGKQKKAPTSTKNDLHAVTANSKASPAWSSSTGGGKGSKTPSSTLSEEQMSEVKKLMTMCSITLDDAMIEFIKDFKTAGEIDDFLRDSVPDTSQLSHFATEFIAICVTPFTRVTYSKNAEATAPELPDAGSQSAAGRSPNGGGGNNAPTPGKGGGKKGKKGKAVDPSILGFSVKSSRIMQGTIDYGV